ncbi:cytochrome b/b6 domain-containing protein [Phosphitispora fastidiosa]|uniref:cytochrome b/b6 domain-containing protein n=1 Tax=Phosphitispora fastidiosa TaxID=2837202 RepID=UPI001E3C877E|nr:cytochrome b/b6 domain-containing protein [Phosphitispora fastidiosa]MBU7007413.1 Ni/Fe-hydrogenase 1 B-type cytochrome subunit [Phosphitispora fastidiosa]
MPQKVYIQSRLTRLFHWSSVITVTFLLISGLYISYPVDLGDVYDMDIAVFMQMTAGILQSGIFLAWVYHHLVTGAYRDIRFRRQDAVDFKGLLKYYFFMEKNPPVHGKYNAGQRLIYSSWFFIFIFMFITGLILYSSNFGYVLPYPVTIQKVRFYHFLGTLWFLGTVPLHIYLVLTEDPAKLQAMFTGWVRR